MSFAKGVSKFKTLTFEQQYNSIKNCPLSSNGNGSFTRDCFYWEFTAQPTPLSKTYLVLLIFHIDKHSPDVFILDQDVWDISKKKSIPHLYDSKKIKLCLYYPAYKDWDQTMPLNTTFVPWTYLWLYYYEEWLFSSEWKGGGEHPSSKDSGVKDKKQMSIFNKFRKPKAKKTSKEDKAKLTIYFIYEQRRKAYIEREGLL